MTTLNPLASVEGQQEIARAIRDISSLEYAVRAEQAASGAEDSKDLAQKWANYTDGAVANNEYSAKKYATDAATSATNASASASSASTTATQLMEYLETKETLTAPAVDPTLAISGAAADAKVVGDFRTFVENKMPYQYQNEGIYTVLKSEIAQGTNNNDSPFIINSSEYRIRTKYPIHVIQGDVITVTLGTTAAAGFCAIYNESGVATATPALANGNIEITSNGYVVLVFRKSDNSAILPSEYDAVVTIQPAFFQEFDDINVKLDNITAQTQNLFDIDEILIGIGAAGGGNSIRALSNAIPIPDGKKVFTIHAESMSSNLKYEIEMYTGESAGTYTGAVYPGWITTHDAVTKNLTNRSETYIRILFGTIDDTVMTKSEFNGMKFQVEYGDVATGYVPYITAVDYVARANQSGNAIAVKEYEKMEVDKKFIPYSVGLSVNEPYPSGQYNRCNILFFTDNHIDLLNPTESMQNVVDAVDYANRAPFHLDVLVNAGDAITPFGVNAKASEKLVFARFADALKESNYPVLFAKGNHDLNDWNNTPANTFNDDDWGEMWYNFAESEWGIVRQTKASAKKSTWNYYDITEHKIRIITVDCQDTDKTTTDGSGNVKYYGGVAWYISNEQMNWIASTALNFDDKDEKDWGVIVLIHQKPTYSTTLTPAYESAIQKLLLLCKAFNTQSTYSDSYTYTEDSFFDLNISADFTRYASLTKKPHMICWLVGHEHYDDNYVSEGINIILTENGNCTTNSSDNRVPRIPGTVTQNCFDLLSIDTVHRKIRAIRFGAGKNCFGGGGDRFLPDGLSY